MHYYFREIYEKITRNICMKFSFPRNGWHWMILDFARFSTFFPCRFSACSSQPSHPEAAWKVIFTTCLGGEKSLGMEMIQWPWKGRKGWSKKNSTCYFRCVSGNNDPCPDFFELRDSMVTWTCTKNRSHFVWPPCQQKNIHTPYVKNHIFPPNNFISKRNIQSSNIHPSSQKKKPSSFCYFSGHVKNIAWVKYWLTFNQNSCPDIPARTLNQCQLMVDWWIWHSIGIPFNPFNNVIPGIKPINHQLTQDLIRGSQESQTTTLSPNPPMNHYS